MVCRWQPNEAVPVQLMALRDELYSRDFDLPGAWWPDQPGAIGGRDRRAGGTWCAGDVAGGVNAVVLNRPERMVAEPGAASRGVLPLRALAAGREWGRGLAVSAMAGFNLVLVGPSALTWWSWDGTALSSADLGPGTYLFTPRGLADLLDDGLVGSASVGDPADPSITSAQAWPTWLPAVAASVPNPEHDGLLIARAVDGDSYETVFGQLIAARPGALRIDYLMHPARDPGGRWHTRQWS